MFILIEKLHAKAELHCYGVPTLTFSSLNNSFTPAHKWRNHVLTFRRTWDFPPLTGWCKSCLICRISETSCLKPALPKSLRVGNQVSQERPWDWSHPKHPKIFITFYLSISAPVEPQQTTNRAVSILLGCCPCLVWRRNVSSQGGKWWVNRIRKELKNDCLCKYKLLACVQNTNGLGFPCFLQKRGPQGLMGNCSWHRR